MERTTRPFPWVPLWRAAGGSVCCARMPREALGRCFVALDTELNREVALKQILDRHADNDTSRSRFLLEAEITGGLEHPGIVPVYGKGAYENGRPYYAMRFIRGNSFKEAIEQFHEHTTTQSSSSAVGESRDAGHEDHGRRVSQAMADSHDLDLRKLLRRFLDVCNAIGYAHSRGVIHRDIKPGNIILGKHGETLVVDWGLAKATGKGDESAEERTMTPISASGSAETLPGSAMGTPAYMSPEQARGEIDHLGPAVGRIQPGRDPLLPAHRQAAVPERGSALSPSCRAQGRVPAAAPARPQDRHGARGRLLKGDGARARASLRLGPRPGR